MTAALDAFFADPGMALAAPVHPNDDDTIPRDRWDRPLIWPADPNDRKRIPYNRASSFGKQIEDTYNLERYNERQVARGMAILVAQAAEQRRPFTTPPLTAPEVKREKDAWNAMAEAAKEAAGSNVKSAIGTAIHAATERVDLGLSTADMPPLLRERAAAYWRFCQANGIHPTSVEVFGVEDVHKVAGTWDRTCWWSGTHKIGDVKTSSTMDFAGIGFAVQLAEYAHMAKYDPSDGARQPHEEMDLERAIIIHVDREEGGPVELYEVDITVGWEYARLVHEVKSAQREGKHAIQALKHGPVEKAIIAARTIDALTAIYDSSWNRLQRELARQMAAQIRRLNP